MNLLLSDRRAAAEFGRAVDGATPGSPATGAAALAGRLRSLAPAVESGTAPSTEFRTALRTRLVAVATVTDLSTIEPASRSAARARSGRPELQRRPDLHRRLGATAGAMATVVALTGVGVAGSRSLPGQPFYGLKTAYEGLELDLAHGDVAKGGKHLDLAADRLREVRALADGSSELSLGSPASRSASAGTGSLRTGSRRTLAAGTVPDDSRAARITETLGAMDEQTAAGQRLLERAWRRTGATEPLQLMSAFAARQSAALQPLLPLLPAASRGAAHASLSLLQAMQGNADQLLAVGCVGACGPAGSVVPGSSRNGGSVAPGQPCPCPPVGPLPSRAATPGPVPGLTPAPPAGTVVPGPGPAPSHIAPQPPTGPAASGSVPQLTQQPQLPWLPGPGQATLPVPVPTLPGQTIPLPGQTAPLPVPTIPLPTLPKLPLP